MLERVLMTLCVSIPVFARTAAVAALWGGLMCLSSSALRAQSWPNVGPMPNAGSMPNFGGMPNMGAMSYDIAMTKAWSAEGMRMTGYASSRGGVYRWIHCMQSRTASYRVCRMMVDGRASEDFTLMPNVDLRQLFASRFGSGLPYGGPYQGGPTGAMETTGQWRWGDWNANGRFKYWR